MNEGTHLDMHRDHQHWLSDGSLWRDEISLWKEESQKALADLIHLENALRQLVQSIDAHEQAVTQHLLKVNVHERSLGDFERTAEGDSVQLLSLAKAHKGEAANHVQQGQAHERLKKEHHTVMAHWSTLLKALTGAERPYGIHAEA